MSPCTSTISSTNKSINEPDVLELISPSAVICPNEPVESSEQLTPPKKDPVTPNTSPLVLISELAEIYPNEPVAFLPSPMQSIPPANEPVTP